MLGMRLVECPRLAGKFTRVVHSSLDPYRSHNKAKALNVYPFKAQSVL
jgi:hypothetical protein